MASQIPFVIIKDMGSSVFKSFAIGISIITDFDGLTAYHVRYGEPHP